MESTTQLEACQQKLLGNMARNLRSKSEGTPSEAIATPSITTTNKEMNNNNKADGDTKSKKEDSFTPVTHKTWNNKSKRDYMGSKVKPIQNYKKRNKQGEVPGMQGHIFQCYDKCNDKFQFQHMLQALERLIGQN